MSELDPLKIYYFVVLATDDPYDVTPFQGFSTSWKTVHWALAHLPSLPCDILERSHHFPQVIAQRMGGYRSLSWAPVSIRSLEQIAADDLGVFVVFFTGEQDCATRVARWSKALQRPTLHVSAIEADGALDFKKFGTDALHVYCIEAMKSSPGAFSAEQKQAGETALANWKDPDPTPSGIKAHGHNIVLPNHMSLERACRTLDPGKPFIGRTEDEYTKLILESAAAVLRVREDVGLYPVHFMTLIRPGIVLAEPALYRMNYEPFKREGPFDEKAVQRTMRRIQTQKGLCSSGGKEILEDLSESPGARTILSMRQAELETFTLAVGLHAAQTTSAVVRLSPGVNHVFPALSAYARSVRSNTLEARMKSRRLFNSIQNGLRDAVGKERIAFIEEQGGLFKIVSDAPMEWLPVGNLPLSIRYDCSRINATPGNMLMALLTQPPAIVVPPDALHKILVVSSFADDDPLREVLTGSLEAMREGWADKAEVVFKRVRNRAEFIDALNSFDGGILIFDGHGADNASEPIGKLVIGGEAVDVWEFRGKVRIPPIVILSACDTHGIDASSQATVGNGFLFLGARTVLATLLPVNGPASAVFIARLLLRIVEFLPAALAEKKRALNWTEVVSGMLRMLLASEMLDALVGPPAIPDTPRGKMQSQANIDINVREEDGWFDNLLERIAAHRGEALATVASKAETVIARSQAIRYVQLGNPEMILIEDGEVGKRVMEIYRQANEELCAGG
ncbi:MAG: CHAT domain-containing protein [Hyphomonadaceae bacterium]|nr:CHAT domain-containing protein [Hyphomonadaceae bacterium]